MSKKRSDRNNNKVLKALRQKKANGGRAKFAGGRKASNWYAERSPDGPSRGPGVTTGAGVPW